MPAIKNESGLIGSCAAAEYLGIHRSTLRYWMLKGHLVPTKVLSTPNGPRFLFSVVDLDNFRQRIDYNC